MPLQNQGTRNKSQDLLKFQCLTGDFLHVSPVQSTQEVTLSRYRGTRNKLTCPEICNLGSHCLNWPWNSSQKFGLSQFCTKLSNVAWKSKYKPSLEASTLIPELKLFLQMIFKEDNHFTKISKYRDKERFYVRVRNQRHRKRITKTSDIISLGTRVPGYIHKNVFQQQWV